MTVDTWQDTPRLQGGHVTLEALSRLHVAGLGEAASDGELWTLPYTSVPAPTEAADYVDAALQARELGTAMPFAVLDGDGRVVGTTRFYDIDQAVPRLQIGYTWYARRVQRTALNTEAKALLLSHAFDVLGCESVGFSTSHLNVVSQAAIERIGARRDGILRAHMRHRDGSLRHTHSYSIVRAEWPAVRSALQRRLESVDA